MICFPEPLRSPSQKHVLGLVCEPIPVVRIAFIGLGKRGKEAMNNYMYIDNVDVVALSDVINENLKDAQAILRKFNKPFAVEYTGIEDWRSICEDPNIDLIYCCTHPSLHTPIAVYAMQCGKHVALEVPAAETLEECWQLVDTAEKTQRHCIMLENCCYDEFGMTVLNMAQHGVLGEIFHVEGGYIHDLRQIDLKLKSHYLNFWEKEGNPYPTHALGPVSQLLNIRKKDKLEWLTSVSCAQFTSPIQKVSGQLGNINTTVIKTYLNKTIILQSDISSPRPYSRNYLVSGTKGFIQKRNTPEIFICDENGNTLSEEIIEQLFTIYKHPFYKEKGELARRVGRHGGMDFIMDYRLIYCLQNGLPLDMDVYDAVEWSCIIPLSATSVQNGSVPVKIPDFTRGVHNLKSSDMVG